MGERSGLDHLIRALFVELVAVTQLSTRLVVTLHSKSLEVAKLGNKVVHISYLVVNLLSNRYIGVYLISVILSISKRQLNIFR